MSPKINHFLWTLGQGKICTNYQRSKRNLTPDSSCPRCHATPEDLNHVFCFSPFVIAVWNSLPTGTLPARFRTGSSIFRRWIKANLEDNHLSLEGHPWASVFDCSLRNIWKNSCQSVFSPNNNNMIPVAFLLLLLRGVPLRLVW